MRRISSILLLPLTLAGCVHGTHVRDFKTASSPGGIYVNYLVRSVQSVPAATGELVATDQSGAYVLGERLRYLRWSELQQFDVPGLKSEYRLANGARPDSAKLERLRLVSRFPQGLDDALLSRVLEALKQDSVLRAPPAPTSESVEHAARAAGYRRIGTDFRGMGEHWLHLPTLLAGQLDPARPTMLAYAPIDGRPTLIGVGFVLTSEGESLPT